MKKVSEIQQGVLNHIFDKLSTIKAIERQVQPFLPPDLAKHCRLANVEDNRLIFAVKNSLWGTQLKFTLPELLGILRTQAGLPALASISYYIDPEFEQLFNCNES